MFITRCLQPLSRMSSRRRPPKRCYSIALARALPPTFAQGISEHSEHSADPLDMTLALQQHASYIQALRTLVPVLELPALPDYPDSVFVEDTVVAINQQFVRMQPGHRSRRGEVESVGQTLQQLGLEMVADMRTEESDAFGDGGDVLYTGRHLFIGLSNRTNAAGAHVLQQAFSGIKVRVIPPTMAGNQVLHLKSAVTLFSPDTLVAPTGPAGDAVWQSLLSVADTYYSVIRVPDVLACNVVAVNGAVLVQDTPCSESRRVLEAAATERNVELIWVNTSELAKKDAALSCCSVLLNI